MLWAQTVVKVFKPSSTECWLSFSRKCASLIRIDIPNKEFIHLSIGFLTSQYVARKQSMTGNGENISVLKNLEGSECITPQ